MTIDANTPILNSVGFDLDDLSDFIAEIPEPVEPEPEPEYSKAALNAIKDEWVSKKGKVSIVQLMRATKLPGKKPLLPHQIKAIKKELDYALATYLN